MLMWHTREGSLGSSQGCMLHNKCIATASHLALVYSDWASDKDAGCCWACASLYLQTAQHTYYSIWTGSFYSLHCYEHIKFYNKTDQKK